MTVRILTAVALGCALLGGCVTLLPKAEPSATYKLAIQPAASTRPAAAAKLNVLRAPTAFPRLAAGDAILTVSGAETAGIAGARWAAPVQVMFDEQMVAAFDPSSTLRLTTRGVATAPDESLRVEVRTFEARYSAPPDLSKKDAKAFDKRPAPSAVVEIKATVTWPANPAVVAERSFRAEVPATENRVSAIVEAYDGATTQVLNGLVGWMETLPPVRPAAASPPK